MNRFGFTAVPVVRPQEHFTARFVGHTLPQNEQLTVTYESPEARDAAMKEEVARARPGVLLVPFEITSGVRAGTPPTQAVKVTAQGILPE